jgi:hypothetical protein
MLRIRDVYLGSEFFPSRNRIKEFKYFNQKIVARIYDPGFSSRIRILIFYASRIQFTKRHRIPDPDPQHCSLDVKLCRSGTGRGAGGAGHRLGQEEVAPLHQVGPRGPGGHLQEDRTEGAHQGQLVFRQCFGSGSELDPDSIRSVDPDMDSESGSRRAKITHKNRKKVRNFMF